MKSRRDCARIRRVAQAIGMSSGLLCLTASGLRAEPWKHLVESEGLPDRSVQFVRRHGDDIWVGTLKGLTVFRHARIPGETVIKGEPVWDVWPAGQGRLWIGTDAGIVLKTGESVTRELKAESVGRIAPFGSNAVWAVCKQRDRNSLTAYADRKWGPVRRFEGQKPEELFPTRDGTVWVALEANGIVAAHPAQAPEQWKHHLPGVKLTAFCEDKQGRIWCGSWDHGIFLLDKGQWTRMLTDEDAVLTAVRQDSKGHIWVATNAHGVWEYDGSQWVNHLADEGTINMLETTADGRVLVSSQSVCSLRQWNGKSWEILLDAPTMFIGAASDSKGKVWAGNILDGLYVQP